MERRVPQASVVLRRPRCFAPWLASQVPTVGIDLKKTTCLEHLHLAPNESSLLRTVQQLTPLLLLATDQRPIYRHVHHCRMLCRATMYFHIHDTLVRGAPTIIVVKCTLRARGPTNHASQPNVSSSNTRSTYCAHCFRSQPNARTEDRALFARSMKYCHHGKSLTVWGVSQPPMPFWLLP